MRKKSGVIMTKSSKKPVKIENLQTLSSEKENEVVDSSYVKMLEKIKTDIQQSQLRAAISVTKELTLLYWRIGKMLSENPKSLQSQKHSLFTPSIAYTFP